MLYDLGVFVEVTDGAEDVALKNYGTRLLKILSGGEPTQANIEEFAKRLMKQPIPRQEEK
jgi:organic radical activating enzyme